jgi:hypothetical protein
MGGRLALDYGPEGRKCEDHGLSIEAARDIWIKAIGRTLSTQCRYSKR